jgi:EAL domain-containing protein (putative c-di-GMP-specific phosphodiesterase class I)
VIIPADRHEEYEWIIREVLVRGSASLETQRVTKSGKVLDISLRAFPIRTLDGRVVGVSTSAHDLTERRERERREHREEERRLWTERIELALAEDRLQFWGQPVHDPRSGRIHHHELLLRMQLDGQIITPNRFLPHAESTELISHIDAWAVREGIRLGSRDPVAINLSAKSLGNPRVLEWVKSGLAEFGTDPANVIFEITETAAAENLEAAGTLVHGLSSLGCSVALDDFGTGYGSFTYLKYLPVSQLKVDITFIRNLIKDQVDRRVVTSIVAVADTFGMQTVAEGVEDAETLEALIDIGIDLAQGYHLGRPRPMEDFASRGEGLAVAAEG